MWPWLILRSTHDALLRSKDQEIQTLSQQLKEANHATARAMGMYQKSVDKLTEALTPKPEPVAVPYRRRRVEETPAEKPKTLNLRDVDPTDNKAIYTIALGETPSINGKVNPVALQRKADSIRRQILDLKAQGPDRNMGTIPGNVAEMIANAEAAGVSAAKVG
jgi:hypothetical protein